MASMHDKMRDAEMMTDEEFIELQTLGWHPDVIQALRVRGFRPCKPDHIIARSGDFNIHRSMGFLRQTTVPHLHITVESDELPYVVLERIDTAIFEAGHRAGHEHIASLFMRLFEQCKNWRPAPDVVSFEKRLADLERLTTNKAP